MCSSDLLITEGQRDGAVRSDVSPRIVARSLWGALDALALTWAIGGGEVGHLAKAGKQVGDMFLSGIASRSIDTSPAGDENAPASFSRR